MSSITTITPQERLALTRKALVKHMNRNYRHHEQEMGYETGEAESARSARPGPFTALKQAVGEWWYRQPASSALELARPLLGDYARVHPFKLLSVAAAVGAATALVRPWRRMSVGGLLLTAVKSSGLAGVLLSLLTRRVSSTQNHQETP